MNARIQELWEHGTFTVIPREGDYSTVTAGSIKSFAELIVRECAHIALREDHDLYECIMLHFGVDDERTD